MPLLRNAHLLRAFLAVEREGNLSAAARTLAVSQPALTKSIRKLEQQFGVALFERSARGMALTESGVTLLKHAKLIEAQCRFAEASMEKAGGIDSATFRVGAGTYWGVTVMPRAIAAIQQDLPRLRITFEVGVNSVILPKLYAGDLDFVMSALPDPIELPPDIETRPYGRLHQRVVAGRSHPLHRLRRVTVADLARHGWVLYQHDRDILSRLAILMRSIGIAGPTILVETTSLHAVTQLLKSGPYLACVPDGFLKAAPDDDIAELPFREDIWSFPSGALFHASLVNATPIRALLEASHGIAKQTLRPARRARVA